MVGLTYNFENDDTDYRNGVDGHLDWGGFAVHLGATHLGLVGYFYHQLSGDSGAGAVLGDYKSRTNGIGPQVGHFFAVRRQQGVREPEGLLRIRREEPAGRVERLGQSSRSAVRCTGQVRTP